MRGRGYWLRRIGVCVLLGAVTAWLVGWAIALGWWLGWIGMSARMGPSGLAYIKPHAIKYRHDEAAHTSWDYWTGYRLDRDTWMARDGRDRIARRQSESGRAPADPPESGSWPPSPADRIAGDFYDRAVSRCATDDDEFRIAVLSYGWPLRCVSETIAIGANAARRLPPGRISEANGYTLHWSLEIGFMKSRPRPVGPPAALRLPLRPLWGGLAADAALYGLLSAVPLVFIPLARRGRRVRRGRCGACGYDLSATSDAVCPECGGPARPGTARRGPSPPRDPL